MSRSPACSSTRYLSLAAALLLTGCAATITCPEVEDQARNAILLDHGRHASLVIENDRGVPLRYSYGDRRWYADDETGVGAGFNAIFRPTPAVLSRRELDVRPSIEDVRAEVDMPVENSHRFQVAAARADRLIERLDAIFYRDPDEIFENSAYDLSFAPHPRPYTGRYNSNHMVADWLEELGCDASGNPMLSAWRVAQPAGPESASR